MKRFIGQIIFALFVLGMSVLCFIVDLKFLGIINLISFVGCCWNVKLAWDCRHYK